MAVLTLREALSSTHPLLMTTLERSAAVHSLITGILTVTALSRPQLLLHFMLLLPLLHRLASASIHHSETRSKIFEIVILRGMTPESEGGALLATS